MDGEVDRVLMKKEEGLDYEVNERVTGRWSQKMEEVVMTEEIMEQVFIEQKQVVEMRKTVEEQWSLEKGEVVMITEEVEQGWVNKKPVVEVSEVMEEQLSLEKEEVVMTEKVKQGKEEVFMTEDVEQVWTNTLVGVYEMVEEHWSSLEKGEEVVMSEEEEQVLMDKKQVVDEMMEERWSVGKEEVVMTEEVEQVVEQKKEEVFEVNKMVTGQLSLENEVVEVDETVVERQPLEKEDLLDFTKTIYDQWFLEKKEGVEIAYGKDEVSDKSEDRVTNFDGNMWKTRESCKARVEYEKAVRKFLTHTTQCSKCVKKKGEKTISIIFVIWFMVQYVHQLFISSVVKSRGLLRRALFIIKQSYVVTRVYVFLYKTKGLLLSRTWSVFERSYVRVITMIAYVDIKRSYESVVTRAYVFIIKKPHELLSRTLVIIGFNNHRLIRRTRLVLEQSYESVVTRLYVFLPETQGLLSTTKIVRVGSSVRDVTIKAYISVKQIQNRLLIKLQQVRRRLFFFGVISVLLCLSGTHFMVSNKFSDHVVNNEWVGPVVNVMGAGQSDGSVVSDKVNDHLVNNERVEPVVDVVGAGQSDGSVVSNNVDDHVVNNERVEPVVDVVGAGQSEDSVVSNIVDDHVVNNEWVEPVVDVVGTGQNDGIVVSNKVDDHVVNNERVEPLGAGPSDGSVGSNKVDDHVVINEWIEPVVDVVSAGQSDGSVVSNKVDDHVVIKERVEPVVDVVGAGQSDGSVGSNKVDDHVVINEWVVSAGQSDGSVVSNKGDDHAVINEPVGPVVIVQEKDVKKWINYVTLVYFITGISVLSFVFFCVYIAITKLRRTRVTMWFVVKQVYHRVFKWRAQPGRQEDHGNDLTNQVVEDVVVGQEDRRVTMWSLAKQTSYQLGQTVLWVNFLTLVSKEEILKSIVYGGLTEIIASISIIAFFADFDTTILNVIAFALAGLIGGCFFFVTNIWELKKGGGDTYREQLGRVNYFPFHATLAMLSFIIFGMIPPSTFVFSFLKTNDKKITIWVVSAASLLCLSLLAIFKAYVTSIVYRFKYVKTMLWYNFIAMGVSICSYLASKMVKGSIEDLGLFDTSACDALSRHN